MKEDEEKKIHRMYWWIISIGVLLTSWMNGGSVKEILFNALMGITAFAFLAIVMSDFFGD